MLALEVDFLLGRYAAADFRDRNRPEWPPHPSRLFSALVAAACETGLGESARAALLWLENLPAPHICAEQAPATQTPVTVFVPVNDPEEDFLPQRAERQPRTFPSVIPQATIVYFVWPDAQPDAILKRLLTDIAANVAYLGNSRSPVRVRVTDNHSPPNWFPDEDGETVLRVPRKGRLEVLRSHFESGLHAPAGAFQRYRCGVAQTESPVAESVYGEMVVYRLTGPVPMEIETTLRLTDVLRAAVMRHTHDSLGQLPEVVSGHDDNGKPTVRPHTAYAALPFVSDTQAHADGRVMGLAVVLPRVITVKQRRQLGRALAQVDHLLVPRIGRLELQRVMPDQAVPHNLRPDTWTGPCRRWASVTPVLLDRFPRRNERGMEAIIARGCEYIGLPPAEVVASRNSPLHGVEPSSRFVTRRAVAGKVRLHTHVVLTFPQAVRGPILLGAGRHFGLGLLRPLREDQP